MPRRWLLLWIAGRGPAAVFAIVAGLLVALPSLPALSIDEPAPAGRGMREHFALMLRDLWTTVRAKRVWLGFVWLLSPSAPGH